LLEASAGPKPLGAGAADDSSLPGEVAAVNGSQRLAADLICSRPEAGALDG